MRAHLCLPVFAFSLLLVGCNTPPISPGKPVDIPTALGQVLDGLCNFRKQEAARKREGDVDIDSITVQLDLTIDGSRNPPVAVAPDIQFIPTVSYGQVITANRGSTLTISLKHKGTGSWTTGDCNVPR
ncbi:hypothetical protein LMG28727_03342 [Paraburkholderia kirstenboschensis]|uniref:hypothetical protein n=1 Tax=Paraburkholderia kirstenboschensis TaxID=1245436 RepID=UPI000B0D416B|nr:hypothetical protein [Paraburkholderia kirstenboschensis]CAD6536420.1 hypothetical protein LMG28727_03342 [Paraburkholderia kirstenboschensis]